MCTNVFLPFQASMPMLVYAHMLFAVSGWHANNGIYTSAILPFQAGMLIMVYALMVFYHFRMACQFWYVH